MGLFDWVDRRRASGSFDDGVELLRAGSYAEAVIPLQSAVGAAPGWAEALNAWGVALVGCERSAEAVGALDQAVELQPGYAEAHSNLADALLGLGLYDRALHAVQLALDIKPGYTTALAQRARVQERLRNIAERDALGAADAAVRGVAQAAAEDSLWGPALLAFEARIGDWALNRAGVIAMWLGGQAAAQLVLDEHGQARDYLHSANRPILEEYHHAFARRMVVRFARLARKHGANLTRSQLDEWVLLLDHGCGVSTTPAGLVETHLLDRQYDYALEGPDDSPIGTGARSLEPALTLAEAHWILGPTDRPNIPRGSLPASSFDEFAQRGGSGLPYDQRDVALAHDALVMGEEALEHTFTTLREEEEGLAAGGPGEAGEAETEASTSSA